ncbi:MAG: hypothetical protein U0835_24230 [Isosphaeraceae bacterium]
MSRDEQLSKERDQPESRQEAARQAGEVAETDANRKTQAERPPTDEEEQAKAELLKSSGGDPLTQEGD